MNPTGLNNTPSPILGIYLGGEKNCREKSGLCKIGEKLNTELTHSMVTFLVPADLIWCGAVVSVRGKYRVPSMHVAA